MGDFTLSGQWDFANEYARNLFLDGRLYASDELVARFNAGWDLDENRVGEALLRFGWSAEAGHDLAVEYRYRREIPRFFEDFNVADDRFDNSNAFDRINQARMFARVALTRRWAIFYSGGFSFRESLSLTNRGGVEYISACSCWAVRVLAERQRARGFQFTVSYTLLGLGMDTVRPFENTRAVSMVGGAGG